MRTEPLTTGEVAEYCSVTYRAVLKWIAEGKLKAYRTPGQHSRIAVNDFLDFLEKYRMPVPPGLERTSSKRKILIVDDDQNLVQLMRTALDMERVYEISESYDGFSAGQKFSGFHPDLVILDLMMPGLNGMEVCANIRKDPANKKVKIIAVSGDFGEDGEAKMLKAGADRCLPKPFEIAVLKNLVARLLEV